MRIVRAGPEMATVLTEIAVHAKQSWGYPEAWMEAWRPQLTLTGDSIRSQEVWVAIHDGRPLGFYALDSRQHPTVSLEHLWVRPDSMGRGLGRRLLEHAVEQAKAAGSTEVSIVADPNSEAFYLKCGARRVGVERGSVCGELRELPVLSISAT